MYRNKKVYLIIFLIITCFFSRHALAKVEGLCSNCHTMHHSQHGGVLSEWGTSGPYKALLINDCVGCHSGTSANTTQTDTPIVFHTSECPSQTGHGYTLAGGDFCFYSSEGEAYVHNVSDICTTDTQLGGKNPPGWDAANPGGLGTDWTINQLTCSGTYGCHGHHNIDDSIKAIYGGHHADNSCLESGSVDENEQGQSVGTSYRFLSGIHGIEDSDWEWTATSSDHNEYKGVNGNASYADKTTISYLCAECHGFFHSITGSSPSWLRHPTDIYLPSDTTKEYYKYNGGTGTNNPYSVVAPVGRDLLGQQPDAVITPGSDGSVVLCISCHRAHGSENFKLMRWDYKSWPVAGDDKCTVCHTTKN
jgi:hypothetical protein